MTHISVVLGTYNRLDNLRRAVESIFRETRSPVTVYVADAGSTDGSIQWLEKNRSERLVPIFAGEKFGQAHAYNQVYGRVRTPYVCWLSDDNEVVNTGLDVAAQILDENSAIGMVALKVRDLQGPFADAPYIGGISSAGILNVNQGMLRTELLHRLGGFDEDFRDYGIDPDLTARVLLTGAATAYTRQVALLHRRDWGVGPESERFREQMARQRRYQERYLQKYGFLRRRPWLWFARRGLWGIIRRLLPRSVLVGGKRYFGATPWDWQNAFCARHVAMLDALHSEGRDYHLFQQIDAAELERFRRSR